jgi:hypothetical protein
MPYPTDNPLDGQGAPAAVTHTPGPWEILRYGDGDSLVIHSDDDTRVCFLATPGKLGNFAEIKGNARLIAAAPDMLEALRESVSLLEVTLIEWIVRTARDAEWKNGDPLPPKYAFTQGAYTHAQELHQAISLGHAAIRAAEGR